MADNARNEFTFEIVEHICVLGKGREEGYMKEFNRVSFRGMAPKYDIREWNSDHTRMTKGMTLTDSEMALVLESMKARCEAMIRAEAEKQNEPQAQNTQDSMQNTVAPQAQSAVPQTSEAQEPEPEPHVDAVQERGTDTF